MKTIAPLLLLVALLCSCAGTGPRRVSPAEFKREHAKVDFAQSLYSHTYLGQRDGKAYLKIHSVNPLTQKGSSRIIYVEISRLDAQFRDSLPKKEMKEPL